MVAVDHICVYVGLTVYLALELPLNLTLDYIFVGIDVGCFD